MNAFINTPVVLEVGERAVFQGINSVSRGCWNENGGWLFAPQMTGQFSIVKAGRYLVQFSAQVTSTVAGVAELDLNNLGSPILGTDMAETLTAVGDVATVSAVAEIYVPCNGNAMITVTNSGTIPVTINNASLVLNRIA